VPDAVDQLAADARVERRHEPEPEAAQPRRQHRHGNHCAPQAALARVLAHQIRVRHAVRAADLVDTAARCARVGRLQLAVDRFWLDFEGFQLCFKGFQLDLEGFNQIGDQVVDRDRLRGHRDPARHHEQRQVLDERADQLERQAARADHDRRAQLDHGHARFAQQPPDLDAAAQVR